MNSCNICQRMKNHIKIPAGKLKLSKVLGKLWTYLMVAFITKLLLVTTSFRSRTTVCSRVYEGAKQNVGNWDKVINIISFTN